MKECRRPLPMPGCELTVEDQDRVQRALDDIITKCRRKASYVPDTPEPEHLLAAGRLMAVLEIARALRLDTRNVEDVTFLQRYL